MYDVERNVNSSHRMKCSEQQVSDRNEERTAGLKGGDMNGFTTIEVEGHVWGLYLLLSMILPKCEELKWLQDTIYLTNNNYLLK